MELPCYSAVMDERPPQTERHLKNIEIFLAVIVTIALLFVLKACQRVAIPIVLSLFVFFLLSPLLDRLDKLHIPHFLGVAFCVLLMIFLLGLAGWFVYKMVFMLIKLVPIYNDRLQSLDEMLTEKLSKVAMLSPSTSFLSAIPVNWSNLAINSLTTASSQFVSILKVCVMVILFVMFMLLEKQLFIPKMYMAFSRQNGFGIASVFERISRQVSKYLVLKAVISLLTGFLFYLTSVIAGLDVPMLYGVLAFVFDFIPSIGSVIVTILTILMSVIQFAPQWSPVVFVSVMTISIQMILGNIIDPKLQGGQLNLSPVVILISLSVWGYIWGIVGMFIAVPLTSCIQILCANIQQLKPVAIILSSGKNYRRQYEMQQAMDKKDKKSQKRSEGQVFEKAEDIQAKKNNQSTDFILPDNFSR